MKRFFFSALFFLSIVAIVSAQDKKVEFGIMAGYGHTMPRTKVDRNVVAPAIDEANLNGFHVGPIVKFNFNEQIGFQTGLLYNYFGGMNIDMSQRALKKSTGTWNQQRTKLSCFDMPLRIVYSLSLADEFSVMLFGGPNLNYSISKSTTTEHFVDRKLSRLDVGGNIYKTINYNALDLQLGAGLGIQWMGVSIRAGYDWGVLNRTTFEGVKLRSNDIKVSLAYTF